MSACVSCVPVSFGSPIHSWVERGLHRPPTDHRDATDEVVPGDKHGNRCDSGEGALHFGRVTQGKGFVKPFPGQFREVATHEGTEITAGVLVSSSLYYIVEYN